MKKFVYLSIIISILFSPPSHSQNFKSWLEQDALFGDWRGERTKLEEAGFYFDLIYTGEYFENVHGGIDEGGEYRGDVSLFLEIDTEQAGWWDGGLFFFQLQHQHGSGITNDYIGDFQVLSNIDADNFTQLSEAWYRHSFLDDSLWVLFGKMEANSYFAYVDYGLEFIHSSPGFTPTIPLTTYPDQDWGLVVGVEPIDWFSMNVGVYQSPPDGGRSIGNTIDNLGGPMLLAEPAFHYQIAGLPGHLRLGGWWSGDEFDRIDVNRPTVTPASESYGAYVTFDQALWLEDEESDQGIGMFAQYGWSPPQRSEAHQYFGGGVQWTGAIPNRDADILGAGVFYVDFSNGAGFVDDGETAFELFYKYQATGWMTIKPDIQYITNPGGAGLDDALAIGVRWEIIF
jgi:porin